MDYLRVLLVPFTFTSFLLVVVFTMLLSLLSIAGLYGFIGALFLQIWVLKYCFHIIEHLADGAPTVPVMSDDMLSPFETRPWFMLAIIILDVWLCWHVGGRIGITLGVVLLLLLPAQIAVLGYGEPPYQALNPLTLFRVIKGLGPAYLLILAAIAAFGCFTWMLERAEVWRVFIRAADIFFEIFIFSVIGRCLYVRRQQLGIEPSRSPERDAARVDAERIRERNRMVDDVFQLVRVGRHVDATKPLADWIRADADEHIVEDARYIAEQSLRWNAPHGLSTVASTLIRYLMRSNHRSDALAIFERLRGVYPTLTLDSADDLRALADYAESLGRKELAQSMRLETPVVRPYIRPPT